MLKQFNDAPADAASGTQPFLLLMPSFNQARFIEAALKSVMAQDDANWQLWIVDNSTDNTAEIVRRYNDPRIRYFHFEARMDPGTCLNWMLERVQGRDFSYVHTDNNLHPAYVRKMRSALAAHPLTLAYCDMRTIDDAGTYTNVYRRGSFDLPRLLSVDTLGVPFAATVELAKQIGGFSTQDLADDVRFCVSAYGIAHYVHVPEPLLDYRTHDGSRMESAGGIEKMRTLFVDLMPKLLPILESRGLQPLHAMEAEIRRGLDDADWFVEDLWHRKLARWFPAWWSGLPTVGHFFDQGLLHLPGFSRDIGEPPTALRIRDRDGRVHASFFRTLVLRIYFRARRRTIRHLFRNPRAVLVTWAAMKVSSIGVEGGFIRLNSTDWRTIWAARQLELTLEWTPRFDPMLKNTPRWLKWGRATGKEPLLDCADAIDLIAPDTRS